MKRFLAAAALTLLPVLAHATPGPNIHPAAPRTAITGTVQVLYPRCMGCAPVVQVIQKNGDSVQIQGDYKWDLLALDGNTVTVQGRQNGYDFHAIGFAPGKSNQFVTGLVEDRTKCTRSTPAVCTYAVVLKTNDGEEVQVNDEKKAKELAKLAGATVTVRGDVLRVNCPPNAMCILMNGTYLTPSDANFLVKGKLEPSFHIMIAPRPGQEWATHRLGFPNGGSVGIYGGKRAWNDRMHSDVWVSGKFKGDKFRGSTAGKSVLPYASSFMLPMPEPIVLDGNNASRNADTDGTSTASSSGSSPSGAGTAR